MNINFWPMMILIICFVLLCKFLGESSNGRYEFYCCEKQTKYEDTKKTEILLLDTKEGLVWVREKRPKPGNTSFIEDYWKLECFEN